MFSHLNKLLLRVPLQSLSLSYNFDKVVSNKMFEDGLYISSPEFFSEYLKNKKINDFQKSQKLDLSITKYWLRSCTRATPYGTFAGSTVLPIQKLKEVSQNIVLLNDISNYSKHVRLDMNYISRFVKILLQSPIIREQIIFFPNNSIYFVDDKIRYVEYNIENNIRKYQISSVHNSPYLRNILAIAKDGATIEQMSELLLKTEGVTKDEALQFIEELCSSQLLSASIEPTITGMEPLEQIITQLKNFVGVDPVKNILIEIQDLINSNLIGINNYKQIELKLSELIPNLYSFKNTIQVDMFLSVKESLIEDKLINNLLTQAEELKSLSFTRRNIDLENFKTSFYKRYENTQVPLSLALDPELGIGYAGRIYDNSGNGEFIDELRVVVPGGNLSKPEPNHLQALSLTKYDLWQQTSTDFIEIKESDLKGFEQLSKKSTFSNSWYIKGSLLCKEGKLNHKNFIFDVSVIGGTSGANLLARFAHGDKNVDEIVKDIVKKEEYLNKDSIFAEIIHLPQARVGNILLRPTLRAYEIPYVGRSGVHKDFQIEVSDLYISVKNNEVILWSKKLKKRVLPRLTTAHNFRDNSLPVYKFLCDLQSQNMAFAGVWDWGTLKSIKHLPRVIYKDLIIHKATWKINEKDIENLPENEGEWSHYMELFRKNNKIPKRVVIKQGDNDLLIDFEERIGLKLFIDFVKKKKLIEIEEFLFTNENCFVRDVNNQPFTNELIIPFIDNQYEKKIEANQINYDDFILDNVGIKRTFFPASEWLYFKIYSGVKSTDKILATTIYMYIQSAIKNKSFEQFFFIRYYDETGPHFRIRFYNSEISKNTDLYIQFMKVLSSNIKSGTIERVLIDTYKRELERYHNDLIIDSELMFYNDSVCVLNFLNVIHGIDTDKYRFLFGMRGIDTLLSDFGLNLEEKYNLLKHLQEVFFNEFGGQEILKKQLNDRFRRYRFFLESHMNSLNDSENEIEDVVVIFKKRSEKNKLIVKNILNKVNLKTNSKAILNDLLSSYIHMYMNRLYISKQRKYELVTYHFLAKFYHSSIGRLKYIEKLKKND